MNHTTTAKTINDQSQPHLRGLAAS